MSKEKKSNDTTTIAISEQESGVTIVPTIDVISSIQNKVNNIDTALNTQIEEFNNFKKAYHTHVDKEYSSRRVLKYYARSYISDRIKHTYKHGHDIQVIYNNDCTLGNIGLYIVDTTYENNPLVYVQITSLDFHLKYEIREFRVKDKLTKEYKYFIFILDNNESNILGFQYIKNGKFIEKIIDIHANDYSDFSIVGLFKNKYSATKIRNLILKRKKDLVLSKTVSYKDLTYKVE